MVSWLCLCNATKKYITPSNFIPKEFGRPSFFPVLFSPLHTLSDEGQAVMTKILQTAKRLLLAAENSNLNLKVYTLKLSANMFFIKKYFNILVLELIILTAMLVLNYFSITVTDAFQFTFDLQDIQSRLLYIIIRKYLKKIRLELMQK